jgi:hypothetical protein
VVAVGFNHPVQNFSREKAQKQRFVRFILAIVYFFIHVFLSIRDVFKQRIAVETDNTD